MAYWEGRKMARTTRAVLGGFCYHVLNRGNGKARVFHKPADYDAFVTLMLQAGERIPMRILGYCLMPNHFHMVLWPEADGAVSNWMQWLMTTHARRYHGHYQSSGHIWQGRFKAFPIEEDHHLLRVLRYVERNPLRANLVKRAEHWHWSSLALRSKKNQAQLLSAWPVERPRDWLNSVNKAETNAELEALRSSVNRGAPYGSDAWKSIVAEAMGVSAAIRGRGRPRKG
jgi:putative transposase